MSSLGLLELEMGPNPGLGDFIIFPNLLVLSIARQCIRALHLILRPLETPVLVFCIFL